MASIATLEFRLSVVNSEGVQTQNVERTVRWSPAIDGGERDQVTLTGSAFTTLTVPTGAKAVVIIPEPDAVSLTLKGVTGDTGTTIAPATLPINGPTHLWLGATPSIGIANGSATSRTAVLIWL